MTKGPKPMERFIQIIALAVAAASPLTLNAGQATVDKPRVLPFLNQEQAEKQKPQKLAPLSPDENLGDYCDHVPLSS